MNEMKEFCNKYGMNEYGLYRSRYMAKKYKIYDEVTVKVEGGYKNMKWDEYYNWKGRKND